METFLDGGMLQGAVLAVLGLATLIKGAGWLISGAEMLATRFAISPAIVGLLVVALGTSLPELTVTLVAGYKGLPGLAIESVLGSNLANLMLVLGVAALIRPLLVRAATLTVELPFSITAALLVAFLANEHVVLQAEVTPVLSFWDGLILLTFFALFLTYCFKSEVASEIAPNSFDSVETLATTNHVAVYLTGGMATLALGGMATVEGALSLAASFGVREGVLGLTIVAIGTSAPELAVSAVAAYYRKVELAVCNVVGSNIINLLLVLGIASTGANLPFDPNSNTDILVILFSSAAILTIAIRSKFSKLSRLAGLGLLTAYGGYLYLTIQASC